MGHLDEPDIIFALISKVISKDDFTTEIPWQQIWNVCQGKSLIEIAGSNCFEWNKKNYDIFMTHVFRKCIFTATEKHFEESYFCIEQQYQILVDYRVFELKPSIIATVLLSKYAYKRIG